MDKQPIAEESLNFLEQVMNSEESVHPISSLPHSKEVIKDAILEYAKLITLSPKELITIKIYYGSLSNFIADDQAKLVNEVNAELEKIGPQNMPAAKEWLSNPANDEREKKLTEIMTQTVTDRAKLHQEFDEIISKK